MSQTHSTTLLGPLEEEIRVAAGGILEEAEIQEEVVIPEEEEEEEEEEEAEIQSLLMTNCQDSNPQSSMGIDKNQRHSYRSGTSIEASIVPLHK